MMTVDTCAVSCVNCSITNSECKSRGGRFQKEATPPDLSVFADMSMRHLIFLYLQAFSKFCRGCCLPAPFVPWFLSKPSMILGFLEFINELDKLSIIIGTQSIDI
jgi:hypothetical protein